MNYQADSKGYYGSYGGAFIPELLYPNVEELRNSYLDIMEEPGFRAELEHLLSSYVGRPSPLYHAVNLSLHVGFDIFLKREDLNHTGAHKINNALGQVLLARRMGKTRIIAETGAGQHGVATATACALMGLNCTVYMGEKDVQRQSQNVLRMKMLGATVNPVRSGSRTLKDATSEAIRDWISHPSDTYYVIGSVVGPHPYPDMVARFQAVISLETRKQLLEATGSEEPGAVVACVGGGSNAAGAFYHFLDAPSVDLIAVEAAGMGTGTGASAATMVLGKPGIIHGSKTILMQDADGQITEPHSISAGLDYPGIGPAHAFWKETGRVSYRHATDSEALAAARLCTRLEGIIPALESAHALAVLPALRSNTYRNVVVCLSGRGDKDMNTYMEYHDENEQD